jgi:outer membrane lipoprotein-sorting protein
MAAGLVFSAAATAAPPTVDELVDKAVAAMGGKAIESIESYTASAEMTAPMGTMTSEVFWAKPAHVLVKRTIPQMGEIQMGTDGTIGWASNPMMGGYQLIEGKEVDQVTQAAMHMRVLRLRDTLKQDYETVKTAGKAEFNGAACHELRMKSRDDGTMASIFFDAESGLIRGMQVMDDAPTGPRTATITLEGWKPIGKVNFFHRMEMTGGEMSMSVRYTRIEVNTVDRALLAMPQEVAEQLENRASRPTGSEMTLEDFSPQVQRMIKSTLDGLPWDDAPALREIRGKYAQNVARMPGEFKQGMEYVIRKIDERIAELGGA